MARLQSTLPPAPPSFFLFHNVRSPYALSLPPSASAHPPFSRIHSSTHWCSQHPRYVRFQTCDPRNLNASIDITEHRVYIEQNGQIVSSFHDIPLFADRNNGILNMIVEVPRWTNAKMEISKEESFNPIKQDIKKGRLRYVRNCFPHHGYIWNYGAFPQVGSHVSARPLCHNLLRPSHTCSTRSPTRPLLTIFFFQTWEDPTQQHPETKAAGDNDPLDVCEIGEQVGYVGQVKQVKVLGIMALLDEGETDWKVLVVDVQDPLASKLNDIEDVERHLPGLVRATNEWFRCVAVYS